MIPFGFIGGELSERRTRVVAPGKAQGTGSALMCRVREWTRRSQGSRRRLFATVRNLGASPAGRTRARAFCAVQLAANERDESCTPSRE
jgi:hypothetical protein